MKSEKLSFSAYMLIASTLFGLFFGAGNLIFPVHMGQLAGSNIWAANLGFLITGVGLPFLGVVAIGISKSDGLYDLASRIHPYYATFLTVLLYLSIGPFFALPRTGSVSFEIGLAPYISTHYTKLALAIFTLLFFLAAWWFSSKPSKILVWIGKILNPLFLLFLAILIFAVVFKPMGQVNSAIVSETYQSGAFFKGFLEGYNTMDALASLAFGIIVVRSIKGLGVTEPKKIALDTVKSGALSVVLMCIIYTSLSYVGATSLGKFAISENGGIALAQIARYYFGNVGAVLLAIIVTLACLKTAIGLITACGETFNQMFPRVSYQIYVIIFSALGCLVANVGLTSIISLAIPFLMFLYPLAITLMLLTFLSPLFKHRQIVYVCTTIFTFVVAIMDGLRAIPNIEQYTFFENLIHSYETSVPFAQQGLGWLLPALCGLIIGWLASLFFKKDKVA